MNWNKIIEAGLSKKASKHQDYVKQNSEELRQSIEQAIRLLENNSDIEGALVELDKALTFSSKIEGYTVVVLDMNGL